VTKYRKMESDKMALTDETKDRIFTEVLYGTPLPKADTEEEREYRELVITDHAHVFEELEQADAAHAVTQLLLRKKAKDEGMPEEELEEELPLPYSDERIEKLKQIFKEMEAERADIKKSK